MLTAERYIHLLNHFVGPNTGEIRHQEEFETSLEELADLFYCTERNVKLIIKKLQDEQLIQWSPGLGRGNRSRIQFMVQRDNYALQYAQRLAKKGEYHEAFEFLHQYEEDKDILDLFIKWLNNQFGVKYSSNDSSRKDIFSLPVYRPPFTLDPARLFFGFDCHLVRQIFDTLLDYDSEQKKLIPKIAHFWENNEDGTQWTFHLRKGITFHHGTELTAHDVVFTLNRLRHSEINRWLLQTMEHIVAHDDRTVHIQLHQPNWLLPRLLCSPCASILPCNIVINEGQDYWRQPSGTGPFQIVNWSDNSMKLTVNEHYFLGRAYLDEVEIAFLPAHIPNASKLNWEKLIGNDVRFHSQAGGDWNLIETLSKGCLLVSWNRNKSGPQQSLAFRQAVNLVIDRSAMINDFGQSGYPARSFLPTANTEFGIHRHDIETAKQLLIESRYDGAPFTLIASEADREEAHWIQQQCATIGIPVHVNCGNRNALAHTETVLEADAVLTCMVFEDDEVCELECFLQENSFMHHYLEPGLHQWLVNVINEVMASSDPDRRKALRQQIEYRIQDEAQILFLIHRKLNTYVHPSVRGLVINSLGWMDFKDIWLTSGLAINEQQ